MTKAEKLFAQLQPSDLAWLKENWEGRREQVFTHHETETSITRHIHVTKLWAGIKAQHLAADSRMMGITDDLFEQICDSQGIERRHLVNITPDSAAFDPGLVVEFPNGEHIIVDGNHKIVKAYQMGLRRRPALFVLSSDVEPYLVHPPENVSRLLEEWARENIPHVRMPT